MSNSQRSIIFWLLLLDSPVVYLATFNLLGGGLGDVFVGGLAGCVCIGGAFYVRSGREKE
jgi:hypothetical protein